MKPIDLNQSIYELTGKYPEMVGIMKNLGFKDMVSPIGRKTGRQVNDHPERL